MLETIQYSSFLDLRQQALFKAQSNKYSCVTISFEYGYIGDAERCIAVAIPKGCDYPKDTIPISILHSTISDNSLSHRDFLGAIMNLKITRDFIGDIIVQNQNVYIVVHSNIMKIIIDELKTVKHSNVAFEHYDKILIHHSEIDDLKSFTVASMRIDTITASLLNISRSDASKLIKQGAVSVNHLEVTGVDFINYDKDIISVKQKGKYKLFCDGNKSRKDRIFIKFKKY